MDIRRRGINGSSSHLLLALRLHLRPLARKSDYLIHFPRVMASGGGPNGLRGSCKENAISILFLAKAKGVLEKWKRGGGASM
eukprot:5007735-Pleurochrysis_carterae.AAC.1